MFKEIAEDIINSINSDLNGYIIDKREINVMDLNKLINMSGIEKLVKRVDMDKIIVLYINEDLILNKCLYDGCSKIQDTIQKKACAKECFKEQLKIFKEEIIKNLRETAKNLDK
ncbi:hypothetical protein Calag_1292 [Caldisphaera lagunensis DSM 15908]|uniref:Uncharacterized protein n=1 Tax=Caldisphaera lagunensis (strain DSM 15908 / JCM 11604 / ANMR 0165 / IC-154) TaxID=1056495 RepID=L0AAU5_CALLD|nr:hypothetical protein [Caldisphaera lagunensis]AFZ71006.1 hypothetical protein Calag_1292 [Caldisphaera lagunensis DSM 15908]